jgi:hypothetical protein
MLLQCSIVIVIVVGIGTARKTGTAAKGRASVGGGKRRSICFSSTAVPLLVVVVHGHDDVSGK